jgi:guanylate kinase
MLTEDRIKKLLGQYPTQVDLHVDIISGPTAVGKNWVADRLHDSHKALVSITSRPKRENEIEGIDYFFVTQSEYEKLLLNGNLATTFVYDGQYYGYLVSELKLANEQKLIPLAIIYYKVIPNFIEKFPNYFIFFMYPPFNNKGMNLLKKRMLSRSAGDFEERWTDTLEQMHAMYKAKPTLLEMYQKSKLYEIKDDNSAWKLIRDLKKKKHA